MDVPKFKIGQKVICIDNPAHGFRTNTWIKGKILTIREIIQTGEKIGYNFYNERGGGIWEIDLAAIPQTWKQLYEG